MSCRYDDFDVPDTMNVHGIYDTKASMVTFESRSEFQKYLQEEAGVSGSYFGFYAGVKSGWGESETKASQKYMALLHVDINRYFKLFILDPVHSAPRNFKTSSFISSIRPTVHATP